MAANDNSQKVAQLKQQLEECNAFIKNAKKETEDELMECQKDYQEACKELDEAKEDYQKALKRADAENFGPQQVQAMKKMMEEAIAAAEKDKTEAYNYLTHAQQEMKELPKLLEQAEAQKKSLEKQLALRESATNSPGRMIGGAIIWAVIIFIILKACGG